MRQITSKTKTRHYDIDWLRIILIISVFLFHVGMVFNTWNWHIKNPEQFEGMKYIMTFLHYWRMPLLFLISGAGTYFALGFRKPGEYIGERFKRLFIPLLAGIFILVPVQVYYERINNYASLFEFYNHMFDGVYPKGNFSWHHLWFICYLFVISLFISPLLVHIKKKSSSRFMTNLTNTLAKPMGLTWILIPLILSQVILRPYFPYETHALYNDWPYFTLNLIFFLAGFIILLNPKLIDAIKTQRRGYLLLSVISTAFMFSTPHIFEGEKAIDVLWSISSIVVSWTCSLTAIGYAKRYLNKDTKYRKIVNEAIYPFYLLHQPAIVVTAYYVVNMNIPTALKIFIITSVSFSVSAGLYWYAIRPFNVMRMLFGMKARKNNKQTIKKIKPVLLSSSAYH